MWLAMAMLLLCGVQAFAMPGRQPPGLEYPVEMLHWPTGDAALLVGTWWHARHAVLSSVTLAVNCADLPVTSLGDTCVSWWLNINYWGQGSSGVQGAPPNSGFQDLDWHGRMCAALERAARTMLRGEDILFFCNHGKHRSGALTVVFLALVLNIRSEEARRIYFRMRGLWKRRDQQLFHWLWESLQLDWFINEVQGRDALTGVAELRRKLTRRSVSGSPHGSEIAERFDSIESRSPDVGSRSPESRSPRSRSRSRSRGRQSSVSTASSVVLGERTNRTDVPIQGVWTCSCSQLVPNWELYCTNRMCRRQRSLQHPWCEGDWICQACGRHNNHAASTCTFRYCPSNIFKTWQWYCPDCGVQCQPVRPQA